MDVPRYAVIAGRAATLLPFIVLAVVLVGLEPPTAVIIGVIAVAAVCLAVYGHATLRAMRATPVTFDRRPDDGIVVRVADKPVLEDEYVGGWYLWPANADGTIDRTSSYVRVISVMRSSQPR